MGTNMKVKLKSISFFILFFVLCVAPVGLTSEMTKDDLLIAQKDGTVLDAYNGLMWAATDNGSDINWLDAKSYCEKFRAGGYADWRMPTEYELGLLYKRGHKTKIKITGLAVWTSETPESDDTIAASFDFEYGSRYWFHKSRDDGSRALPVRFIK
jgi:hypothetical protein